MATDILPPHTIVDVIDRWTIVSDGPTRFYIYLDQQPVALRTSKRSAWDYISQTIQRMQVADAAQDAAESAEDSDKRYAEDIAEAARSRGFYAGSVQRGDAVRR